MHSIWIHVGWTGQAGNCVWQAWTSTWPTLASHLNVEQLEDALAGLNDVIQGLENYGKKGVESCKEGGGSSGPNFGMVKLSQAGRMQGMSCRKKTLLATRASKNFQ